MAARARPAMANRRSFLLRSCALVAGAETGTVWLRSVARATPQAMQEAIRAIAGEALPKRCRISLEVPPLVENGNAVPLTIAVDSR